MAQEIGSLTHRRDGSGPRSWAETRWHAAAARPYPETAEAFADLGRLIRDSLLPGHAPAAPPLAAGANVITLGSCFAAELRHFLNQAGLSSDSFWVPSGLNNTYALRDFVSWCVTGAQTEHGYRYDRDDDGGIREWTPAAEREAYRGHLERAGAIVFTIGLAEVWEDSQTGGVFWRGVPESIFDAGRHRFRLTSVAENEANLAAILDLIRAVNPTAPVVVTLSPVPLKATFRDISCVSADCVSKSTLRVAIDQVMRQQRPGVYYWPSFEIVKWLGCHLPHPVYGTDDGVVRHVSRWVVLNILSEFIRCFYGEAVAAQVAAARRGGGERPGGPGEPPLIIPGTFVDG